MTDENQCGCGKSFRTEQGMRQHMKDMRHSKDTPKRKPQKRHTFDPENKPDWTTDCEVCGQRPIVPITGMCGPCTFGEAATANGNW